MSEKLPALSVIGTPTKRGAILELAAEADRRGFAALACPSLGGALSLCASLAHVTHDIHFFTSIQPIYNATVNEIGASASHINEVSGGRFALGLGVSHEPMVRRLGVPFGAPLADISDYVFRLKANEKFSGPLPPIYLAAMRDKMLRVTTEIASGSIWANAAFSDIANQLTRVPAASADDHYLACMIPTVITDDEAAGAAVNRKTMVNYVSMPNYRNYWKSVGYAEEMVAAEAALEAGDRDAVQAAMTDRWLSDCTLYGSPTKVRDRLAEWYSLGVTPIAVMSSTSGGQAKAIGELFDVYA
jgi:alkanesulfonate monooxygenase SsuD/methylene tetrahydromethanopterin reductase-like flavin-dependent oxidoreductase (luciferase family)